MALTQQMTAPSPSAPYWMGDLIRHASAHKLQGWAGTNASQPVVCAGAATWRPPFLGNAVSAETAHALQAHFCLHCCPEQYS